MAYTIVKTDGTVLTSIPDGTINTTSTSIGLPGRNYAGYGQTVDTNFVHQLENFAANTPPANPLRGQLWYNTNTGSLWVCPTDGETNGSMWNELSTTSSGGTTTFGTISVTGNITTSNISISNNANVSNTLGTVSLTVTSNAAISNATMSGTTVIDSLTTTAITSGSASAAGTLTGVWSINGPSDDKADAVVFNTGGIYINNTGNHFGIKTDKYMWANGDAVSFAGTYNNSNVAAYLPTYSGNVGNSTTFSSVFNGNIISTGSSSNAGVITGNWSLSAGSRLNATYADLAERFEADMTYDAGTVVSLGGEKEITAVEYELSEDVFGVISNTAAYLMNSAAGSDKTHPPVAVSGRVPVKVIGTVNKGDRLVSAGNGIARAAADGEATPFNTIGRALENKTDASIGYVEAFVSVR